MEGIRYNSTHVMVVVRVRVITFPRAVSQSAVMSMGVPRCVQAACTVEQRQTIGEFVMEMVAPLG